MVSFLSNYWKQLFITLRSADMFGMPISLTYNRNNKFKTYLGGWWTLLIFICMAIYFSFLFWSMISRRSINFANTTIERDLIVEKQDHVLPENGFFIAIGLRGLTDEILDPIFNYYFQLKVTQVEYVLNENKIWETINTNIELERWGDKFPYANKTIIDLFNFDGYACLKSDDYAIGGNWYSDRSKYFIISLEEWDYNTNECATYNEINSNAASFDLDIIILDRYFDLENFEQPIKSYLTDGHFYGMVPWETRHSRIYIQENNVKMIDNYFQFGSFEEQTFYSVSKEIRESKVFNDNKYVEVTLILDSEKKLYTRTVFSFLDMIAQLGGVFNVIYAISMVVLTFYAERQLYYWIIRKWYQHNSETKDTMPVYYDKEVKEMQDSNNQNDRITKVPQRMRNSPSDHENKKNDTSESTPSNINSKEQEESETDPKDIYLDPTHANYLAQIMKQRRRFDFSFLDILYGTLWCIKHNYSCCK